MPLDGLRAWIGEVERKLGMRTRVFLVLATIAIGGAGAAIYLAIDTRDNAVSESDVQELQQRLEGQGGGAGSTVDPKVIQLETELKALQAEVDRLEGDGKGSDQGGSGAGGGTGTSGDGEASTGDATESGAADDGAAPGAGLGVADAKGKLRDLLEEAKEQSDKAEEAE